MSLQPRTTLGGYEIVALIGAGGMGEVYEARDARLGRRVALKVLPESLADDGERNARFDREAKLLAAFNHPHIASLYGIEESAGRRFLVMELVEGDELAERIARGPIALADALDIARQIAEALDAAHEQGIVHRDLKPANIKITTGGAVKVLDFGLAKETAGIGDPSVAPTALGQTQPGVVVGTAAYMAPEQAQGHSTDKRVDIWAYGVVLYEMLTGKSPFASDSLAGTLAAVLTREPDFDLIPDTVRPLVRRCLARNPKQRLRDVGDAVLLLDSVIPAIRAETASRTRWLPLTAAIVALTTATAMAAWMSLRPRQAELRTRRFVLDTELANPGTGFAISPEGTRLAFAPPGDADQRLWLQDLVDNTLRPIAGTEGGKRPFFSPDGQWFAFFTGQARLGHLKKVPIAGNAFNTRGSATTLCESAHLYGGSWTDGDDILFTGPRGLMRVSAAGGTCESISSNDKDGDHRWPHMLPDRKHVLFSIGFEGAFDSARIAVLDLQTRTYRVLLDSGANARYLPSGHLVFARAGQLFSVPFNLARLEVAGRPQVAVESIFHVNAGGFAAYTVDAAGTLVYATPEIDGFEWRNRNGVVEPTAAPPGHYRYFRLSPDGMRVALQQSGRGDVEVVQLDRGTSQRLTSENMNHTPIWMPDGRTITFATLSKGIYQRPADGSQPPSALLESSGDFAPWDWTADGRTLFYEQGDPLSIWTLTLDGASNRRKLLLGRDGVIYQHPTIAPNGRWLAYVSNESGTRQVTVQPFPALDKTITISVDGGEQPHWSRDGRELFFLSPRNEIMMADIRATGEFSASAPRVLIPNAGPFDIEPTGQRFLVVTKKKAEQIHLVENWFAALRRLESR